MFKILGAKNRRKYLHKHPGPPFQIRGGPGCFSIADNIYEVNWQIIQEQTKSNPYQDGFAHARIPKHV